MAIKIHRKILTSPLWFNAFVFCKNSYNLWGNSFIKYWDIDTCMLLICMRKTNQSKKKCAFLSRVSFTYMHIFVSPKIWNISWFDKISHNLSGKAFKIFQVYYIWSIFTTWKPCQNEKYDVPIVTKLGVLKVSECDCQYLHFGLYTHPQKCILIAAIGAQRAGPAVGVHQKHLRLQWM